MRLRNITIKNSCKLLIRFQNNYYARYSFTILSIVGGYLALFFLDTFSIHSGNKLCLFRLVTTIPCPGCGMARATVALFHFDITTSLSYNILCIPFTIAVIISLLWAMSDLITHKEGFYHFVRRDFSFTTKVFLFSLIMIDWVVNVIRLKN